MEDFASKSSLQTLVFYFLTLANELQKNYDAKDPLNLFRKQYGNIFEALKAIKNPFFVLDNMVIRMKKPDAIRALKIRGDLM